MENDNLIKLAKEVLRLHNLSKDSAENIADVNAKIVALVLLLSEKGIISLESFDKKHAEVSKQLLSQLNQMTSIKPSEGKH